MATYKEIFEQHQYDVSDASQKSSRWFKQQIKLLSSTQITGDRLLRALDDSANIVRNIIPGDMYLFKYDPKTKDTLPMWDVFPLIIPFKYVNDGFLALNFHYLPYQKRVILLDNLSKFNNNSTNLKIKFSWDLINGMSKLSDAKQCVKRYIKYHIISNVRRIEPRNWATALLLPVEQFVYNNRIT